MGQSIDEEIPQLLRAFRRQRGVKQVAIAEWLGITQAHYSRIESGIKQPSRSLHRRIVKMLDSQRFQSTFSRWRLSVQLAPTNVSLIRARGDGVALVEFSKGFKSLGGVCGVIESGDRLDGVLGDDADYHFSMLKEIGAFDGDLLFVENIWSTSAPSGDQYYRALTTAIPDDDGGICLHSQHQPIASAEYSQAVNAGNKLRIIRR